MLCPNCGRDAEVRHGYCTECGAEVRQPPTEMPPQKGRTTFDPAVHKGPAAAGKGSTTFDPGVQHAPAPAGKGSTRFDPGVQRPPVPTGKGSTTFDPGIQKAAAPSGKGTTTFDPGVQHAPDLGTEPTVTVGSAGRTRPGHEARRETTFDPGSSSVPGDRATARPTGPPSVATTQQSQPTSSRPPDPGRRLVGWLVTFSHRPSGEDHRLYEGRNVIGASSDLATVTVPDDVHMSGKHAVIMYRDRQFLIRDADSSNGTFVNGKDIFGEASVVLGAGDSIRCGSTEFKIYVIE